MTRLSFMLLLLAPLVPPASADPLAHTFSIVARDPQTGEMGVAVQSHWFSVGSIVTWAEAGVGAVATQSFVDPAYGPLGLALMRSGKTPVQALEALLSIDPQAEVRQVAMIAPTGPPAVHTGDAAIAAAGHYAGDEFAVQANLMRNDRVWPAMAAAFRSARGDLAVRMIAALEAGQAAGGDIRGQQSAAILVVRAEPTGKQWVDRIFDLRVEDHPDPIAELRRLVVLQRAYAHMNRGDELSAEKRWDEAMAEYRQGAALAPDIEELPYWVAVTLFTAGREAEALPIFREVFAKNADWVEVTRRLPASGLLPDDPAKLATILAQAPGGANP
ncbi:MAG TPA: DUF1028 domain-containing protein [Thermoanaerobaculia bacterium]|nr:DUF1028 domain-containing protein [Thermoanaerobaculia bacterium]